MAVVSVMQNEVAQKHDSPTRIKNPPSIAVGARHFRRGKSNRIRLQDLVFFCTFWVLDQSRLNDLDQALTIVRLEQDCLKA